MTQKNSHPARDEDLRMNFVTSNQAGAFVLALQDAYPKCSVVVNGSIVKIWDSKNHLEDICTLSGKPAYGRCELHRITSF